MSEPFAELHEEMQAVTRSVLSRPDVGRSADDFGRPLDWKLLADLGWLGLEAPEVLGGSGGSFAELAVLLHEMGRAAARTSVLGSVTLGIGALNLVNPITARDSLLREVATGESRVAVALATGECLKGPVSPYVLEGMRNSRRLCGEGSFVPDAVEADRVLVLAMDQEEGVFIICCQRDSPGLQVEPQPVLDGTRSLATVIANDVLVTEESILRFGDDPEVAARRLIDRAALAIACDSLGLAEAMLDTTVAYVQVRHQFGRPIGSFQAVKHACADMLVQVSVCQELLSDAIEAVVDGSADAPFAVSRAKSHICEAAVWVVGKAMQLHGGIGYAWDTGIHVYLKRASLNRSLFGAARAHRARLASRYGYG
jgi:alkylation response protein AidB-like acyl-CoA dehydrogenase